MKKLKVPTQRGVLLDGVLFGSTEADTVMIAITGIHGNFYSNPFYYNIGNTLNGGGIDFIYAQTNDAFGQIGTMNIRTGEPELIGSWNERFEYTDDDIDSYLTFAQEQGYKHIILAGHSLGANKVIYYLSRHHDERVEKFILLSPANLTHMMSGVTEREKEYIFAEVEKGRGERLLPFDFMYGGLDENGSMRICLACADYLESIEVSGNGTSVGGIKAGVNEAYFEKFALALAKKVEIPVILVGGHRSIEHMNKVLNNGGIEYLSLSRPLVREADLINRWQGGDCSPAKCVSCNMCYHTPAHKCIYRLREKKRKRAKSGLKHCRLPERTHLRHVLSVAAVFLS